MPTATPLSLQDYEALAARDPDGQWELWAGTPKEKPAMTFAHNDLGEELAFLLRGQLDRRQYRVRSNKARVRWSDRNVFIPDVAVIPAADAALMRDDPAALETYHQPLPLVVEIWSRSTGDYDLEVKILTYKARGDAEIWRIHPGERQIERWILRDDGTWQSSRVHLGSIVPAALPDVSIDLAALFSILG